MSRSPFWLTRPGLRKTVLATAIASFAVNLPVLAQVQTTPPAPATPAAPTAAPAATSAQGEARPTFKQEELDQMLAPLALYPDPLLSQILMASTYPLEIVQADRWLQQNKLTGDALADALEKQPWDASVKSLVQFPDVLKMLDEKIDNTIKLGDAFLGQQQQVMDTIQKLRGKANDAGNLKSTKEQTVKIERDPDNSSQQVIVIEPADPQVIYVPTYNPTVIYGTWWYPSYPPYYYYPPSYNPHPGLAFGAGLAIGFAWGYAWGHCTWGGHSHVDIDINRNININNRIDRNRYTQNNVNLRNGQGQWQHNPAHRDGVAYRDRATAQKFGGQNFQNSAARDAYRGRADMGRQELNRGGAADFRSGGGGFDPSKYENRGGGNLGARDNRGTGAALQDNRGGNAGAVRDRGGADRGSGTRSGAFNDIDRGGQQTRNFSQRGQSSRSSHGGGGGHRGGGGRGGGARGGGGRR